MKIKLIALFFVFLIVSSTLVNALDVSELFNDPNAVEKIKEAVENSAESEAEDILINVKKYEPTVVPSYAFESKNYDYGGYIVKAQLSGIQTNPLIEIPKIRTVTIFNQRPDVPGVVVYPVKPPYGIYTLDNMGYLYVRLPQIKDERKMPKQINVNLTAKIFYDVGRGFGVNEQDKILVIKTESEFIQTKEENSFWSGRGYINVDEIKDDSIRISIYDGNLQKIKTFTIQEGKTSPEMYLGYGNFFPNIGEDFIKKNFRDKVKFRLNSLDIPKDRAKLALNINGRYVIKELAEGDKLDEDSNWRIKKIYKEKKQDVVEDVVELENKKEGKFEKLIGIPEDVPKGEEPKKETPKEEKISCTIEYEEGKGIGKDHNFYYRFNFNKNKWELSTKIYESDKNKYLDKWMEINKDNCGNENTFHTKIWRFFKNSDTDSSPSSDEVYYRICNDLSEKKDLDSGIGYFEFIIKQYDNDYLIIHTRDKNNKAIRTPLEHKGADFNKIKNLCLGKIQPSEKPKEKSEEDLSSASKEDLIFAIYNAFIKTGFSDEGAKSLLGEVGRENSFNINLIFGDHIDPHNKKSNFGFFSWQGDRGSKLADSLRKDNLLNGDKIVRNQKSLDKMASFVWDEMSYPEYQRFDIKDYLSKTNINYNPEVAADKLCKYIKWRCNDPKYALDGNNNRREWYSKAEKIIAGKGDQVISKKEQQEKPEELEIDSSELYIESYKKAIEYYKKIVDDYINVVDDKTGKNYALDAQEKIAEIYHKKLFLKKEAIEAYQFLFDNFALSQKDKVVYSDIIRSLQETINYGTTPKTLYEYGSAIDVSLQGIILVKGDEVAQIILSIWKNGAKGTVTKKLGENIDDTKWRIDKIIGTEKIELVNTESQNALVGKETRIISASDGEIFLTDNVKIELIKIDSKREAKLTVLPGVEFLTSTSEFKLHIPVERRLIQFSDKQIDSQVESTKKIIESLNKAINSIEKTYSYFSYFCWSIFGWVTVKNLFSGGRSAARKLVMDSYKKACNSDPKYSKDCNSESRAYCVSKCIMDKSDQIEKALDNAQDAVQKVKGEGYKTVLKINKPEELGLTESEARELAKSRLLEKSFNSESKWKESGLKDKFFEERYVQEKNALIKHNVDKSTEDFGKKLLDDEGKIKNNEINELKKLGYNDDEINKLKNEKLKPDDLNTILERHRNQKLSEGQGNFVGEYKEGNYKGIEKDDFDNFVKQEEKIKFQFSNDISQIPEGNIVYKQKDSVSYRYEPLVGDGGVGRLIIDNAKEDSFVYFDGKRDLEIYADDKGSLYKGNINDLKNQEKLYIKIGNEYKPIKVVKNLDKPKEPFTPIISIEEGGNCDKKIKYISVDSSRGEKEYLEIIRGSDCTALSFKVRERKSDNLGGKDDGDKSGTILKDYCTTAQKPGTNLYVDPKWCDAFLSIDRKDSDIASQGKNLRDKLGNYVIQNAITKDLGLQCYDIMDPDDCKLLFFACDPVMCPTSRFNAGGKWPVNNVVASGLFGSIFLGTDLWSNPEIGICIPGVLASLKNYRSILQGYQQCLITMKEKGENVGICDTIRSIGVCKIIWREGTALLSVDGGLLGVLSRTIFDAGSGGGEYAFFAQNLKQTQDFLGFFTNNYASTYFNAYRGGSTEEIGDKLCEAAIYGKLTGPGSFLDQLTKPEGPPQFTATLDEFPHSDSEGRAMSDYSVYYHIYAGESYERIRYEVYLKSSTLKLSPEKFYMTSEESVQQTFYLNRGDFADATIRRTGPTGYDQVCVQINGIEKCGFGKSSSEFLVDYIQEQGTKKALQEKNITSEDECIGERTVVGRLSQGDYTGAVGGLFGSSQISDTGVRRRCGIVPPDKSTPEQSAWIEVGTCGKDSEGRDKGKCWLNTNNLKLLRNEDDIDELNKLLLHDQEIESKLKELDDLRAKLFEVFDIALGNPRVLTHPNVQKNIEYANKKMKETSQTNIKIPESPESPITDEEINSGTTRAVQNVITGNQVKNNDDSSCTIEYEEGSNIFSQIWSPVASLNFYYKFENGKWNFKTKSTEFQDVNEENCKIIYNQYNPVYKEICDNLIKKNLDSGIVYLAYVADREDDDYLITHVNGQNEEISFKGKNKTDVIKEIGNKCTGKEIITQEINPSEIKFKILITTTFGKGDLQSNLDYIYIWDGRIWKQNFNNQGEKNWKNKFDDGINEIDGDYKGRIESATLICDNQNKINFNNYNLGKQIKNNYNKCYEYKNKQEQKQQEQNKKFNDLIKNLTQSSNDLSKEYLELIEKARNPLYHARIYFTVGEIYEKLADTLKILNDLAEVPKEKIEYEKEPSAEKEYTVLLTNLDLNTISVYYWNKEKWYQGNHDVRYSKEGANTFDSYKEGLDNVEKEYERNKKDNIEPTIKVICLNNEEYNVDLNKEDLVLSIEINDVSDNCKGKEKEDKKQKEQPESLLNFKHNENIVLGTQKINDYLKDKGIIIDESSTNQYKDKIYKTLNEIPLYSKINNQNIKLNIVLANSGKDGFTNENGYKSFNIINEIEYKPFVLGNTLVDKNYNQMEIIIPTRVFESSLDNSKESVNINTELREFLEAQLTNIYYTKDSKGNPGEVVSSEIASRTRVIASLINREITPGYDIKTSSYYATNVDKLFDKLRQAGYKKDKLADLKIKFRTPGYYVDEDIKEILTEPKLGFSLQFYNNLFEEDNKKTPSEVLSLTLKGYSGKAKIETKDTEVYYEDLNGEKEIKKDLGKITVFKPNINIYDGNDLLNKGTQLEGAISTAVDLNKVSNEKPIIINLDFIPELKKALEDKKITSGKLKLSIYNNVEVKNGELFIEVSKTLESGNLLIKDFQGNKILEAPLTPKIINVSELKKQKYEEKKLNVKATPEGLRFALIIKSVKENSYDKITEIYRWDQKIWKKINYEIQKEEIIEDYNSDTGINELSDKYSKDANLRNNLFEVYLVCTGNGKKISLDLDKIKSNKAKLKDQYLDNVNNCITLDNDKKTQNDKKFEIIYNLKSDKVSYDWNGEIWKIKENNEITEINSYQEGLFKLSEFFDDHKLNINQATISCSNLGAKTAFIKTSEIKGYDGFKVVSKIEDYYSNCKDDKINKNLAEHKKFEVKFYRSGLFGLGFLAKDTKFIWNSEKWEVLGKDVQEEINDYEKGLDFIYKEFDNDKKIEEIRILCIDNKREIKIDATNSKGKNVIKIKIDNESDECLKIGAKKLAEQEKKRAQSKLSSDGKNIESIMVRDIYTGGIVMDAQVVVASREVKITDTLSIEVPIDPEEYQINSTVQIIKPGAKGTNYKVEFVKIEVLEGFNNEEEAKQYYKHPTLEDRYLLGDDITGNLIYHDYDENVINEKQVVQTRNENGIAEYKPKTKGKTNKKVLIDKGRLLEELKLINSMEKIDKLKEALDNDLEGYYIRIESRSTTNENGIVITNPDNYFVVLLDQNKKVIFAIPLDQVLDKNRGELTCDSFNKDKSEGYRFSCNLKNYCRTQTTDNTFNQGKLDCNSGEFCCRPTCESLGENYECTDTNKYSCETGTIKKGYCSGLSNILCCVKDNKQKSILKQISTENIHVISFLDKIDEKGYGKYIDKFSNKYLSQTLSGVKINNEKIEPEILVKSIILKESGSNLNLFAESGTGSKGLMQVTSLTAGDSLQSISKITNYTKYYNDNYNNKKIQGENRLDFYKNDPLYDPEFNILLGTKALDLKIKRLNNNKNIKEEYELQKGIQGYNAGEGLFKGYKDFKGLNKLCGPDLTWQEYRKCIEENDLIEKRNPKNGDSVIIKNYLKNEIDLRYTDKVLDYYNQINLIEKKRTNKYNLGDLSLGDIQKKLLQVQYNPLLDRENRGSDTIPFDDTFINVNAEKLEKITNTKYENQLKQMPNLKNAQLEKMQSILHNFGNKIEGLYCSRTEVSCDSISHVFYRILEENGIDAAIMESSVHYRDIDIYLHIYVVVKINNQEFRFDFTADQMSKEDLGLVVTPRIKNLTKGEQVYFDEKKESEDDFKQREGWYKADDILNQNIKY